MNGEDREQELKERLMRRKLEKERSKKSSYDNNDTRHDHRDEFGRTVPKSSSNNNNNNGGGGYGRRSSNTSKRGDDRFSSSRHNNEYYGDTYENDDSGRYRRHGDSRNETHRNDDYGGGGNGQYYGPGGDEQPEDKFLYPGLVIKGEVVRIESYGAFVQFQDKLQHQRKGLAHISQLANYRVENVTDVLKLNQIVHCVILDVEDDQRSGKRIRLSLKDVNQDTGVYTGKDISRNNSGGGGGGRRGRPLPPKQLADRAQKRRESLLSIGRDWKEEGDNAPPSSSRSRKVSNSRIVDMSYLRKLWSASPEPPQEKSGSGKGPSKKDKASGKKKEPESSDDHSSSGSDGSSSVSSDGSESDRRSRSRRSSGKRERKDSKRRPSNRSRKKDESKKRDSKTSRRGRSRRRKSPSPSSSSDSDSDSESSTSSSSSSSSSGSSSSSRSSSGSSTSSHQPDAKRVKLDDSKTSENNDNVEMTDPSLTATDLKEAEDFKQAVQGKSTNEYGDDEDDEEGPMPLPQVGLGGGAGGGAGGDASAYGKALLPGEGQAIAQYVQQNLRIPRRGEIGYSGDDIDHFEKSGYVMSGSRHARMNAVRIRKENQVYSAEEQRALALLTMEENQQKEAQLMEDFRTMLKEKQKAREKTASSSS